MNQAMDFLTGNKMILIVDDSPISAKMVTQIIQKIRPNVIIKSVSGGREALQTIANNDYAGVITDLNMPGMDGFELTEKVKQDKPDLPIALLTATDSDSVVSRSAAIGVTCLGKPPTNDKLESFLSSAGV